MAEGGCNPTGSAKAGDDTRLDAMIGILLRAGVYSSAAVILAGGLLYLIRNGGDRPDYGSFHGSPPGLGRFSEVVIGVFQGESLAIMQFGLLMLIATPVARVIFSVIAFSIKRDYLYVAISAIVLAVLMYSLFVH